MKIRFFTTFLLLFLCLSAKSQIVGPIVDPPGGGTYEITVSDVVTAVKALYPENADIEIYYTNRAELTIVHGTVINTAPIEVLVDEDPDKGWEHNCTFYTAQRYYPVQGHAHFTSIQHLTLPPANRTYIPYETDNTYYSFDDYVSQNFTNGVASRNYAVLINGGSSNVANYQMYWWDCSNVYRVLTQSYHIPSSNVYSCISDGTASGNDMNLKDGNGFASSSIRLNGTDITPNLYSATKSNIISVFSSLSNVMTSNDHLFVFITGPARPGSIDLWGGDSLTVSELDEMLCTVSSLQTTILLGQSYGRSFVEPLLSDNRLLISGYGASEQAEFMQSPACTEFVCSWLQAINGCVIGADSNNDGFVSFGEAFESVKEDIAGFDGFMEGGTSNLQDHSFNKLNDTQDPCPIGADLYIRDNETDDGTESNTHTEYYWDSPDIYVRRINDGFDVQEQDEIPATAEDVYIYVRVTNRGQTAYTAQNHRLHIYIGPSVAEMTSYQLYGTDSIGYNLYFNHIYAPTIRETILPGESTILKQKWSLDSDLIRDFMEKGHGAFTIVAFVTDANIGNFDVPIDSLNYIDILASRKLAMKSCQVINVDEAGFNLESPMVCYRGSNPSVTTRLEVIVPSSSKPLLNFADISLKLDNGLYNSWNNNGEVLVQAEETAASSRTFKFTSNYGKIENLVINQNESYRYNAYCDITNPSMIESGRRYVFHVVHKDIETGHVLGGYTYVLVKNGNNTTNNVEPGETVTRISSVSPSGASGAVVSLSSPAVEGMEVCVSNASNPTEQYTYPLEAGQSEQKVSVGFKSTDSKMSVITLKKDGVSVDNKKYVNRD